MSQVTESSHSEVVKQIQLESYVALTVVHASRSSSGTAPAHCHWWNSICTFPALRLPCTRPQVHLLGPPGAPRQCPGPERCTARRLEPHAAQPWCPLPPPSPGHSCFGQTDSRNENKPAVAL